VGLDKKLLGHIYMLYLFGTIVYKFKKAGIVMAKKESTK
tara:strand:- start:333 stop:449 length:117 start_codon:yes stop_codon:yes gene_type:complete